MKTIIQIECSQQTEKNRRNWKQEKLEFKYQLNKKKKSIIWPFYILLLHFHLFFQPKGKNNSEKEMKMNAAVAMETFRL